MAGREIQALWDPEFEEIYVKDIDQWVEKEKDRS